MDHGHSLSTSSGISRHGASSPSRSMYCWYSLMLIGFHTLKGIFFFFYATRFITSFLMVPFTPSNRNVTLYHNTKDSSAVSDGGVMHLGKGSWIALYSFINLHLHYMVLAVVKDSLPAWKAQLVRKVRPYFVSCGGFFCSCCPTSHVGVGLCEKVKHFFAVISALLQRIPCRSGLLLTLCMGLLWVPLNNFAGLGVYTKVVFSCYTVFLFVEDNLPSAPPLSAPSPAPVNLPIVVPIAGPSCSDVVTVHAVVETKLRSKVSSRRSSSPPISTVNTPSSTVSEAIVSRGSLHSGSGALRGRRSNPPTSSSSSSTSSSSSGNSSNNLGNGASSNSFGGSSSSTLWVCELAAGLGILLVVAHSRVAPAPPGAEVGWFSLVVILLVTGLAGFCYSVGMLQCGLAGELTASPPSREGSSASTLAPSLMETAGDTSRSNLLEGEERTFMEFYRDSVNTCRRPSMQAFLALLSLSILHESFMQQYAIVFVLAAAPPDAKLLGGHWYWLPVGILGTWVAPLLMAPLMTRYVQYRGCHLTAGSHLFILALVAGLGLLVLGVTGTTGGVRLGDSVGSAAEVTFEPGSNPVAHFYQRFFWWLVAWLWLYIGIVGGCHRVLLHVMGPNVVKEDRIVFSRGVGQNLHYSSSASRSNPGPSAYRRKGIVEELFALTNLLSRATAAIFGCVFFWVCKVRSYGTVGPLDSISESEAWPLFQGQLRLVTVCIGAWIAASFLVGVYVWRQFYKLYGHHKAFIDSSIQSMDRERIYEEE